MKAATLRKSILQYAIQGKLVPQNLQDEPAYLLLAKIRKEKQELIKQGKLKKEKPLAPITEDEKPFDIPDSWVWVRLGEISSLNDGEKKLAGKLPYLEAKYLRGNIEPKVFDEGQFVKAKNKLILVDGENSGEVFELYEDGYLGSTFKVLIMNNQVNERYYRLLILCYKDYFRDNKKGAAIPHLNRTLFRELCVGLPPLAEQDRIVAKIEELMILVDKYEKLETELEILEKQFPERLKKSILQYAIQGKLVPQLDGEGNAKTLLDSIKKEKQELIKQGKLKKEKPLAPITEDEKPFDIPYSWEWARLHSMLDVRDGTHDSPKYVANGYPFITSKNLCNGKLDLSKITFISKGDFDNYNSRSFVENNDILFAMIGSVGNPIIVNKTFEFAIKNVALIKHHKMPVNINYVYWVLFYFQTHMINESSGGVQKFVSLNYLRNFIIPLPPLAEQQRIVDKIEELFALVDLISQGKKLIKDDNIINQPKVLPFIPIAAKQAQLPKNDFNDFELAARAQTGANPKTVEESISQIKEYYGKKN